MTILNSNTVIEDSLVTAFELRAYLQIMEEVKRADFRASASFRTMFNGFYRVRQKSKEWYDTYYALMEEQRAAERPFDVLLRELYQVKPSLEVSFVSKLIATVDPDQPIWDQYVIRNLGLDEIWKKAANYPFENRLEIAARIYELIGQWYREFLPSDEGRACIAEFDRALPHYKDMLSSTKKVDYLLWSKR